jgi:hypothetical protein
MKYETPGLTALMPAINAIQSVSPMKPNVLHGDSPDPDVLNEAIGAYADWE